MRLWTLHPMYLDSAGLVALWREALLARAVLRGHTNGYRYHPQLQRFRECRSPRSAINAYITAVYAEARSRNYRFDASKLGCIAANERIVTTRGQLKYEWCRLLEKLRRRDVQAYEIFRCESSPAAHPLFTVVPGPICAWERVHE